MMLYEVALLLLFVKHWACDFVFQTPAMIAAKSQYRSWPSILHSLHHAGMTFLIFALGGVVLALVLALIDFVLHYHIDYTKVKYGEPDSTTSRYWNHFGLDQLAHYMTYLIIVAIFVRIVE